ncbi:hypothetical protein [Actinoplanes subglobosus]|uniref:Uncharacterized protein n=1 Tax=Actinoplanes subglobosus TaxID=1547892 RepID=A0ABV8IQV9_9ACTN
MEIGRRAGKRGTARRIGGAAAVLVILAGCLWSVCFGWLYVFADEGAMPPKWRIPPVPAGTTVLEEGMQCASGGCWWALTLQPPAGQSPEDLRRQMGLETEKRLRPTLTDPAYVITGANIRQGHVVVYVRYG